VAWLNIAVWGITFPFGAPAQFSALKGLKIGDRFRARAVFTMPAFSIVLCELLHTRSPDPSTILPRVRG
jgi:hypothetical protein